MGGDSRKVEPSKKFVDMISTERGCSNIKEACFGVADEKKLELRLAPPGYESLFSLGHLAKAPKTAIPSPGAKRGFSDTVETEAGDADGNGNQIQKLSAQSSCALFPPHWSSPPPSAFQKGQHQKPAILRFQSLPKVPVLAEESSQPNGMKGEMQKLGVKACSLPSATVHVNAGIAAKSHARTSAVPVVGWPPIRTFRKNIAGSSLKPAPESQIGDSHTMEKTERNWKGLFVKINMDGVPIGRKVDLNAYDSYVKLSSAVDELFRGLLEAQRDSSSGGSPKCGEERRAITGLVDGSGEYTLVYEDNEGDRMLVGDIPWEMFVTSVKRLRVLKSSELSALCRSKEKKVLTGSGVR